MKKRAVLVLIACFCTVFITYSIRYGYGVLLPEMLPSLEITKTQAGVMYSSYFIAYTVLSPVLGLMGDRYDIRVILTLFTAILGGGTLLMASASSVAEGSLYFTIAGVGASACWAPVMALAQRWASTTRKGTTLAVIDTGSSLGIVWMGTAVPAIVVAYGWPAGWLSLGALGLLIALINFIMVREPPLPPTAALSSVAKPARKPVLTVYRELAHDKKFWLLGIAYMMTGFSILVPFTFLSTYAVEELAFPYEMGAGMFTVIGIGAFVGKLVLGSLSDRFGRIRVMLLCTLLFGVGALGMIYARIFTVLVVTTIVFSLGYGAVWPMYAASASDYFSREVAGSIVGIWTMLLGIGSILSPVIAGWLGDVTGTLAWSFGVAVGGAVIALALLTTVWKGKLRKVSTVPA